MSTAVWLTPSYLAVTTAIATGAEMAVVPELSIDPETIAQDVQAAIAQAILPPMPRPPSYAKQNPSEQPILYLALASNTLPLYTVTDPSP